MVLAGIKRDKPKHLFVGSSPVPSTKQKSPETTWFQDFSVILTKDAEHIQAKNAGKVMKKPPCFVFTQSGFLDNK